MAWRSTRRCGAKAREILFLPGRLGQKQRLRQGRGASIVVDYRQDSYIERIAEHGPYDVARRCRGGRGTRPSYIERVKPTSRLMETGTTTSCLGEPRDIGPSLV